MTNAPAIQDSDDTTERIEKKSIYRSAGAAVGLLALGHFGLTLRDAFGWTMPWQGLVGFSLASVGVVTFTGFYIAARRARVAVASSVFLTFLSLISYALTVPELGHGPDATQVTDLVNTLMTQFTSVVTAVTAFYFGSEAVIQGLKIYTVARNPDARHQIGESDIDLVQTRTSAPTGQ